MSSNLYVDTSMDFEANGFEQDQKRQLLLAQMAVNEAENARLAAQLAELAPLQLSTSQSSNQHHRSPIQKQSQQRRSSNVPRSISSTGVAAMSRHLSDRNDMSQRPRALSHRSATSMARTNSRGTPSQRSNVPFTQNGAIPPPLNSEPPRENSMIMDWATQEQPYTTYTFSQQNAQLQLPTSQRNGLQQVPEFEDPGEYILRTMGNAFPSSMSSPATINNNHHFAISPFNQQIPSTPTDESLTTATTLASEMSRQNSEICHGIESMQFTANNLLSTDSYNDQSMFDHVSSFSTFSHHSRRSSNEEQSQLLVGTGGASQQSKLSPPFQFPSSDLSGGTKMEKSESVESASSTSSSRSAKRLKDYIAAGQARPIMPRGGSASLPMSRDNSAKSVAQIESKDGLQDKLSISKPSYKRPQHDRVFCKICDNHPEGFRGEHEHRRHVDREHKRMVKKWICIEPTDGGQHPRPIVPLARCKACSQQKKKYGAYYNAAAHLRRAHFNPKPKGRSKSQQKIDDADKRGGKGGGDEPDMPELKKFWMKEVEVQADHLIDAQKETADDSGDEQLDTSFDEQPYTQQTISNNSNISFNDPIFNDNNNNKLAHYCSTVNFNDNDLYGIADMPLEFSDSEQQVYPMSSQIDFSPFSAELFQSDLVVPTTFVLPQSYNDLGSWNN
ncbi:hypothetical protein VTL71DRAFT_14792 [Oculimacula yallundae]|uniref:DUF7896 domain-containing protein n=1 Tax=Oculimacula yallundae TaxID=86028 RepID=A0ABR4CKT0_9HELO